MTEPHARLSADIATLADEWEASARKHIAAGNEEDCEAGTEEWMLHAESARIYRKCADQLVTALAKGIINVAQAERVWHRKDCPFCGSPDGQYSASVGELSAAFFCKGCGINQPAHPPAAPVETDAAKMCNSYLERALKAEAALAAHNGSSAASEPAAWLVTWTTKNNGPTASAYVRERDARDAARNVEKYADASNVVVAPAYTDLPQTVRMLDWQETFTDRGDGSKDLTGWEAETYFGTWYSVEQYFASDSYAWHVKHDFDVVADCDDPEQAKEAAQADFEKRVSLALSRPESK